VTHRPPTESQRTRRLIAFNPAVLMSLCAAGALFGVQACGSSESGGGSAGSGTATGGSAPGTAGTPGTGTAGSSGSGTVGTAGAATGGAGTATAGSGPGSAGSGTGGSGTAGNGTGGSGTAGGGSGTAGSGNTAGSGPVAGAGGGGTAGGADDVLQRNKNASRDAHFIQPKLTKAAVPMLTTDSTFMASFTGNMWASPLYIANGPGGKGVFIAVATNNNVYAIDETTGAVLWTKSIGTAPTQSGAGCGNISPIGIISTPVIDAAKRVVYVAGATGAAQIEKHEIHALNIETGMEVSGWPIDVTGTKAGSVTFAPKVQNQRSALSLVGGTLYVAYGGHVGDCGLYRGWVISVNTADPTKRGAWATLDTSGSAIWAAGGMASDGTAIFAATGNHTPFGEHAADRTTTDSEQVVRLTGLSVVDRKDENLFFPTTWKTMDDTDADLGGSNPVYFSIPGATPPNYVASVAKDGKLYVLNAANLGGMGGAVATINVASGNMAVKTSPTVYRTAEGTHITFSTDSGAMCPMSGTGPRIVSVLLTAGSPLTGKVDWCAPQSGEVTAPIATTTDGTADAVVWFMSGGKLNAVDGDSGASLYTSANNCSGARRWSSPIAVKGRIVVGGDTHLCSWSVK